MTEVIGILGFAVLFAVFGLLRGRVQEPKGCDSCPDEHNPNVCGSCHLDADIPESYHG